MSALAKKLDIECTWIRVFSIYGPNDRSSSLIMRLMGEWFAGREVKLKTDGNQIWNYYYSVIKSVSFGEYLYITLVAAKHEIWRKDKCLTI